MATFSDSTFTERLAAVRERMAAAGLDAILVYAVGSALGMDALAQGHMRFLADWDGYSTPSMLIVPRAGPPTLVVARPTLVPMAHRMVWFGDVRAALPGQQASLAADLLRERAGARARVGHIGRDEMPVPVWEALKGALPGAEWSDATLLVAALRTVKTDAQRAYHRRAADICDQMFETFAREVGRGRRGYQLKADMEHTAKCAGAEQAQSWLSVGPVADDSHYFKEMNLRVPQAGDQVLVGVNVLFEGHWGHAVRSGTMGPAKDAHRRLFDLVLEMQEAAIARLAPGGDVHDLFRAAEGVLSRHHPGWREKGILLKRIGHSQGMSYDDVVLKAAFPDTLDEALALARSAKPIVIEPGMLFEVHPIVYVPGVSGAGIGDLVAVTGAGHEILTRFPRELIVW